MWTEREREDERPENSHPPSHYILQINPSCYLYVLAKSSLSSLCVCLCVCACHLILSSLSLLFFPLSLPLHHNLSILSLAHLLSYYFLLLLLLLLLQFYFYFQFLSILHSIHALHSSPNASCFLISNLPSLPIPEVSIIQKIQNSYP